MIDRLRFSMQSLQMFARAQEVAANNLANMNTPGFKKDKLFYEAFHSQLMGKPVMQADHHQTMNMEPGSLEKTGNTFDFAIEGNGFFQVEHNNQLFLTRNGRFGLDAEGYLRDENGALVQGSGGAIFLPQFYQLAQQENREVIVEVAKDGTIRLNGEIQDKIRLVRVDDVSQLERRTNSYLAPGNGQRVYSDPNSFVNQGFYETGNVNPLEEMVEMTTNLRLFETQQRVMRTHDEILSRVSTDLGRF